MTLPWPVLLAAGASVAAIFRYMQDTEDEIKPAGDTAEESVESEEESLLDKIVDWIKNIPEPTGLSLPRTVPQSPAIASTNKGASMVGQASGIPKGSTEAVASYIRQASSSVGVDANLLFTVAKIESNFKPSAQNKLTKATGLFQILPSTWGYLIKKYKHLGYTASDINDPAKNAMMGAVYIKSIQDSLGSALGRAPNATETYLGHFLGPSGAARFLRALAENPSAVAATMFGRAAKANRNLFYAADGTPLTLAQVMDKMNGKVTPVTAEMAAMSKPQETAPPVAGQPDRVPQRTNVADASYSVQPVNTAMPPVTVGSISAFTKQQGRQGSTETATTDASGPGSSTGGGGQVRQGNFAYVKNRQGQLVAIPT